jgi:hypothetical protein
MSDFGNSSEPDNAFKMRSTAIKSSHLSDAFLHNRNALLDEVKST